MTIYLTRQLSLIFSITIVFSIEEFQKNFKWLFGGCLTYTSAPLRDAVKHPPNNSLKLGYKGQLKAERNGAFAAKPLGESPHNSSLVGIF